MSVVDHATVRKIARLARIRISEERLPELARDLSRILSLMDELRELDVSDVEPMVSVIPMHLKRRPDVVTEGGNPEPILANAPDAREGFFAVPKVVE